MKIVAADGTTPAVAYFNAWIIDPDLEGVRLAITIADGQLRADVHAEDRDAVAHMSQSEIDDMLARAVDVARSGEAEMCDNREVEAWII